MEDRSLRSPSSSNTAEKDGSASQKQAACLNCRKSKTRCLRNVAEDIRCKKCAQTGAECIVPDYRVGRKKGIKKYSPFKFKMSCISLTSNLAREMGSKKQSIVSSRPSRDLVLKVRKRMRTRNIFKHS